MQHKDSKYRKEITITSWVDAEIEEIEYPPRECFAGQLRRKT